MLVRQQQLQSNDTAARVDRQTNVLFYILLINVANSYCKRVLKQLTRSNNNIKIIFRFSFSFFSSPILSIISYLFIYLVFFSHDHARPKANRERLEDFSLPPFSCSHFSSSLSLSLSLHCIDSTRAFEYVRALCERMFSSVYQFCS